MDEILGTGTEQPNVIAALHVPALRRGKSISLAWLEDYVMQNMGVFAQAGVPAVILQDQTQTTTGAKPEISAVMSALGRLIRKEYPQIRLGIIVEAHDPETPLAIAHASGAAFVRIKVFVGSMLKAAGIQQGVGIAAVDYRTLLGREDIQILADVHDRTGHSLIGMPIEQASSWAARTGADGLILTGNSFGTSLDMIRSVREAGIKRPLFLGGGATVENIGEALATAEGAIVSQALKRDVVNENDMVLWDVDKAKRFMEAAYAG